MGTSFYVEELFLTNWIKEVAKGWFGGRVIYMVVIPITVIATFPFLDLPKLVVRTYFLLIALKLLQRLPSTKDTLSVGKILYNTGPGLLYGMSLPQARR